MVTAVLRYTNCMFDEKTVMNFFAQNGVEVVKVNRKNPMHPKAIIRVHDDEEVFWVVSSLNKITSYEVSLERLNPQVYRRLAIMKIFIFLLALFCAFVSFCFMRNGHTGFALYWAFLSMLNLLTTFLDKIITAFWFRR